jgi:hypothetical protein
MGCVAWNHAFDLIGPQMMHRSLPHWDFGLAGPNGHQMIAIDEQDLVIVISVNITRPNAERATMVAS